MQRKRGINLSQGARRGEALDNTPQRLKRERDPRLRKSGENDGKVGERTKGAKH